MHRNSLLKITLHLGTFYIILTDCAIPLHDKRGERGEKKKVDVGHPFLPSFRNPPIARSRARWYSSPRAVFPPHTLP